MAENISSIRGYRVLADRKIEKQYSVNNLLLNHAEAKALENRDKKIALEEMKKTRGEGKGVPCIGRAEDFSGDDLMGEREAQLACAGCPAFKECDIYRIVARPSHGIFAGTRRNMEIPDD